MRTWEAERLELILEGGRTNPLVASCSLVDQAPPLHERYVVKAKGLPEVTELTLQNEIVGNLLGRMLGLETPRPELINISNEAADAFNSVLSERGYRIQPGLAAGCEYLQGMSSPVPDEPLEETEMRDAARLYAFDLFAQNPDRTRVKPNCSWRNGRLVAYDFELCFSFALLIGAGAEPWELRRHEIAERHLFWPQLRGKDVDWEPIVTSVSALTEARLDAIFAELPTEWHRTIDRIKSHLLGLAEHQKELRDELQRSIV